MINGRSICVAVSCKRVYRRPTLFKILAKLMMKLCCSNTYNIIVVPVCILAAASSVTPMYNVGTHSCTM